MKITLVLALARYYNNVAIEDIGKITRPLIPPILMAAGAGGPGAAAAGPRDRDDAADGRGTAILFVVGVRLWKFGLAIWCWPLPAPSRSAWQLPARLPEEARPHLPQSGAGPAGRRLSHHPVEDRARLRAGCPARGSCRARSRTCGFLPETQTDFIFTMLAEEFGMVGARRRSLILYAGLVDLWLLHRLSPCRSQFGRILADRRDGFNFFLYVFINIAMVIGLIPVVGVPLPLISWGGTALLTVLLGFGFLANVAIHREVRLGKGLARRRRVSGLTASARAFSAAHRSFFGPIETLTPWKTCEPRRRTRLCFIVMSAATETADPAQDRSRPAPSRSRRRSTA